MVMEVACFVFYSLIVVDHTCFTKISHTIFKNVSHELCRYERVYQKFIIMYNNIIIHNIIGNVLTAMHINYILWRRLPQWLNATSYFSGVCIIITLNMKNWMQSCTDTAIDTWVDSTSILKYLLFSLKLLSMTHTVHNNICLLCF